ncbi:MAG: hypothetical protein NT038_04915 [Euryarchaeota archaeon]|nr:hypothetical protein [Euryarchaeota archaeon]
MSPLKANDKLIIIGGIIVLVVAVIGIALYVQPTPETPTIPLPSQGTDTYDVTWSERSGSLQEISEFASKKTPYEGNVKILVGNIKSITFNLSWIDDKAFLKRFGLDTLTIEITTPDGKTFTESAKSAKRTKAGNIALTVDVNTNMPSDDPITATSQADAEKQIQDMLSNKWMNKEITVKVSVKVGGLFLKIFDKGNDFTLIVDYQYYKGSVTPINVNDENKPTSLEEDWRATPFFSTSLIGRT